MTIGPNAIARIRADMALADLRRIGCPGPTIVDAIVIGGVDVGSPAPIDPRTRPEVIDAVDRGFAVRREGDLWEPTALGVLAAWGFHCGFFAGP